MVVMSTGFAAHVAGIADQVDWNTHQLPDTAQWALFRICRQDLREHSDVSQFGE